MVGECPRCGSGSTLKLDVKENKVVCIGCHKTVEGLSTFMMQNMKQQGDTIRLEEKIKIPEGGIVAECKNCHSKVSAELNKKDLLAYCTECGTDLGLSELMLQLLKENGVYSKKFKEKIVNVEDGDLDLGNNPVVKKTENNVQVNSISDANEKSSKKKGRPSAKKATDTTDPTVVIS